MSERGYIAVDRGLFDNPTFAPERYTEREAWLWMIAEAAWKPCRARVGRAVIALERGQLAFSTRFLATKWRWSESRVRRFLDRLTADALIVALASREATHLSICNYDKYQNVRRTGDAVSDAPLEEKSTQRRTNNQSSSLRSEDEEIEIAPEPAKRPAKRPTVLPSEWRPSDRGMAYAAEKGLSPAEIETEVEKIRNWSISQRKTAVDWDRSWMNWVLNAVQRYSQSGARNDRNARSPQRPESHPGPRRKHTMASVELEEQAWAAARERSGPVGFDFAPDERGTLDFGPVGASAFGLDGGGNGGRAQGRPDASVVRLHVAGGR
jgi:hypothetical protein